MMRMNEVTAAPVIVVRPGKIFAAREPVWIRTVLGSCVSVCLCDPVARIGGMNHFMLPGIGYSHDPMLPARYGIQAMELLINALHKLGADRRRLEAMAFGGSDVLPVRQKSLSVAQANIAFVREFIDAEKIPLIESLLGGVRPMRISLLSTTGEGTVEFVGSGALKRIVESEQRLLTSVAQRTSLRSSGQVTIF